MTTNNSKTAPKKIAVLGGGLSAMTALFHLFSDPEWESKYDVTVYQLGWRIGGKGASGVNRENGCRIEEHGLHLWMGFYENAFAMMKKVYELNDRKAPAALATFDDAFKGQGYMVFEENIKGKWLDWQINFPMIEGKVGDGKVGTFENLVDSIFVDIFHKIEEWMEKKKGLPVKQDHETFLHHLFPESLHDEIDRIKAGVEHAFSHAAHEFFFFMCEMIKNLMNFEDRHHPYVLEALDRFESWMRRELEEFLEEHDTARRLWVGINIMTTMFKGMMRDGMIEKNNGVVQINFDVINKYDYAQWFAMHGADPVLTVPSSVIRSMYDGPFAFIKGDITKPNIEAGTTLRNFLRLSFTCKEQMVWRMQAGMGDTIFGPVYEVFKKHFNVKFKFFHRVKNLKLSSDGQSVAAIEIGRQVRLKQDDYDPLWTVNNLPCWPSEPLYEQLNEEDVLNLKSNNINLESSWTSWKDTGGNLTLEAGKDFDAIILGASLASMRDICPELIATKKKWQDMINHVQTVQTQAYQFWLNKSPEELNSEPNKLLSCYVEPVDTYAEMNQLLPRENWPASANTKYIAYICGAFPDAEIIPPYTDITFPDSQWERVKQNMEEYFSKHLSHILPDAFENGEFKWEYLVDLKDGKGKERLYRQYIRANIDPSERYVLSVVDSSRYRIKTNETGCDNLFITGDWIQNHYNSGFVECAVTAGILTARAISGDNSIPIYMPDWDKMTV